MSPRRNRPKGQNGAAASGPSAEDDRAGRYGGWQSTESWRGEEWNVRHVAGASAQGKTYRCPGCDHEIRPGTPHLVAWPADDTGGVADRRHWHKPCWDARSRRRPGRW